MHGVQRPNALIPPTGAGGLSYGDGREFNPRDLLNVVLRRRWTVAAMVLTCLLTGIVLTLTETPMYTSTALLKIEPGGLQVMDFDSVQESNAQAQSYSDFYQTQYEILSSRALARRTIENLDLGTNSFLNGDRQRMSLIPRAKRWVLSFAPALGVEKESPLHREQRLVDRFLEEVIVAPRRKSFLVELSYQSPDPELSRSIANTMAHEYIDLTLDQGVATAAQVRDYIQKQVAKVKASLEQAEEDLQQFARGHDIAALEQEERVIDERLADLNTRLTEAEAHRIELAALDEQARSENAHEIAPLVNNPLIKSLREQYAYAEAERAELSARFTSAYPDIQRLDARIAGLRSNIRAEERRLLTSIGTDFAQAQQRETLLRSQLQNQKALVANYAEKAIAFKIHQREVETTRALYEDLLRRMKEVEVTEAIRASNITLVDAPELPLTASSPNIPVNLALAVLLGIVGGLGLAFGQEYLDDSLKTPDDIERHLQLATLGTIPEFDPLDADPDTATLSTPDLEVCHRPTSAGSEAIRTLRASLFLAAPGGLPSRLLLTSARPSEGKTCIAINVAAALAQMGRKVCLIDCDLRRPRVNKALGMSLSPGVTNHVAGNISLDEIIRPSVQPGLDIITAGPIPPNPVDLLDSGNMSTLLRELEERYDQVLIDAPPALGFSDVPIISKQLGGGCLLVTRSGETSKRLVRQAVDYLTSMQSKLLGVVLNRISTKSVGYSYYGYYGYYGDYYANREEDETLKVEVG